MSTIPQPLASVLELLVRALTALLEWLAYHRPTILRAGTVDELVLDRQRLWDALEELDKQGGRVLDIGTDLGYARSRLTLILDETDPEVRTQVAKTALEELAKRRDRRRERIVSETR